MSYIKNPIADLKIRYKRYFEISLILSLLFLIFAFKFSPGSGRVNAFEKTAQELIRIEDVINTVQKPDIPPLPKTPQIIEATVDDITEDIELPDVDIDENAIIGLHDLLPPTSGNNYSEEPFIEVPEELPQPIGGILALQKKVHYTELGKKAGIEGTVIIEAWIDKEGNVVNAFVRKRIGGGLDEEALNAVKLTKFHPGTQRGIPVKVKMFVPIRFVLK